MKWVSLFLMLYSINCLSYQNIRPGSLLLDQSILSRGIDLLDSGTERDFFERLESQCILGNTVRYGQKTGAIKLNDYVGFESKREFSTIGGKSKVDFWIASAKASVQYLMEEASTVTRESNSLTINMKGPKYRLEDIQPRWDMLSIGPTLCGDAYIHHVEKGVTQILSAGLEFFTREKKEAFKAKVKIKLAGGLIKKTFRYNDEHKEFFENAVMTISHYYEGGMTNELLAIRDNQPTNKIKYRCTIANLQFCIDKYNEYYSYLTSQDYANELRNEDIYKTLNFGVSTYDEAGLPDITREVQSPIMEQYTHLIDMTHDLQDLYSLSTKLKSEQMLYEPDSDGYRNIQTQIDSNSTAITHLDSQIENCYVNADMCS